MQDHEFAVLDQPSRVKVDLGMDGISPKRGREEKLPAMGKYFKGSNSFRTYRNYLMVSCSDNV